MSRVNNKIELSSRFDIYIKCYYLSSSSFTSKVSYFLSLHCINNFIEYDDDFKIVKCGYSDFKSSFDSLFTSIDCFGFDISHPIPIYKSVPTNGAHRISSCIVSGKEFSIIDTFVDHTVDLSYDFFKKKKFPTILIEKAFESMIPNENNLYCACLYPSSNKYHDNFLDIISDYCNVVIDYERVLTEEGKVIFTSTIYEGEKWLGTRSDKFKGAKNKYKHCFLDDNTVRIVCFKFKDGRENLNQVLDFKQRFRDICNLSKHSIHITDNDHESKLLLSRTLNSNNFHWLNNQKVTYFPRFESFIESLKVQVANSDLNLSDIVVTGSAVLSAYGVRDCQDFDLLINPSVKERYGNLNFDSHNEYYERNGFDISHIFSENLFFVYNGVNFLIPNELFKFKKMRGEPKDVLDLKIFENSKKRLGYTFYFNCLKCYLFNVKIKKTIKKLLFKLKILR